MELTIQQPYQAFFKDVKHTIQHAQLTTAITVNQELVKLYRTIGTMIVVKQRDAERGDKIVGQLAKDLRSHFPGLT